MAATALVLINEDKFNKKEVDVTRFDSIDTLKVHIEDRFKLEKGSISHLQIWSRKFNGYKDLEKFEEVEDGCGINAMLTMVSVNEGLQMLVRRIPEFRKSANPWTHTVIVHV